MVVALGIVAVSLLLVGVRHGFAPPVTFCAAR